MVKAELVAINSALSTENAALRAELSALRATPAATPVAARPHQRAFDLGGAPSPRRLAMLAAKHAAASQGVTVRV